MWNEFSVRLNLLFLFIRKSGIVKFVVQPFVNGAVFPLDFFIILVIGYSVKNILADDLHIILVVFQHYPFDGLLAVAKVVILLVGTKGYDIAGFRIVNG